MVMGRRSRETDLIFPLRRSSSSSLLLCGDDAVAGMFQVRRTDEAVTCEGMAPQLPPPDLCTLRQANRLKQTSSVRKRKDRSQQREKDIGSCFLQQGQIAERHHHTPREIHSFKNLFNLQYLQNNLLDCQNHHHTYHNEGCLFLLLFPTPAPGSCGKLAGARRHCLCACTIVVLSSSTTTTSNNNSHNPSTNFIMASLQHSGRTRATKEASKSGIQSR